MGLEVISTEMVDFEGAQREYEVVSRHIERPSPRFFVRYNSGKPFISDEVPVRYRGFMVYHELYEFEKLGLMDEKSCVKALEKELDMVGSKLIKGYVQFRRRVFGELVDYLRKFDTILLDRVEKSFERLKVLEALV